MDTPKELKRKASMTEHEERSSQSERKRKKKDGKTGSGSNIRPKHYPLSERQQLALLMQMTAEENNEQQAATPPPATKRTPGGSGRKDKVNKRNERGETSLHIATIRGELPMITDLVKQGADVNVQDYAGWTPLHEACNHGYLDIAKFLLEAGAIVNSKGFNDDYPLHDAVMNEHTDLVELLLKHGANPLLSNKQGERPLDLAENEEIKRLMQNEILLSDDSDQNDGKVDEKTPSGRRPESIEKQSSSNISRELFKQFDTDSFRKIVSSSDSEDSDNVPLSRRRTTSIQSKSSSSSNHTLDQKTSSSSFVDTRRSKQESKSRLFSTESSESVDSEAKSSRQKYSDFDSMKPAISSEDEFFSHSSSKTREDRFSTDSIKSSTDKKSATPSKRPLASLLNVKAGEADVYDFSPNSDDFSNESNAISLKAEAKPFNKWESQSKQPGLFQRKTPGLFSSSKGFDCLVKKNRKPSKDTADSTASDTTALIKPVHETAEMLFDKFCKSPQKEDSSIFTFETKLKPSPVSSHQVSLNSPVTQAASTTESFSNSTTTCKPDQESIFSVSFSSPSSSNEATASLTSQKTNRHSNSQSNLFQDVFEKDFASRSFSIDNASLSTSQENLSRKASEEKEALVPKTVRAISLDSKDKTKKVVEESRVLKREEIENTSVKKVKSENKDKLSKTLSDPQKKLQSKQVIKDSKSTLSVKKPVPDKPKLQKSISTKKDIKTEKKVLPVSDIKSSFLSDLDKTSVQRHQEKLKRKKLVQKKAVKPGASGKVDEKKASKKTEVKLIETAAWLGPVSEKTPIEKQRKPVQRSVKKTSDASTDSEKQLPSTAAMVDTDSASKTRPVLTYQTSFSKVTETGENSNASVENIPEKPNHFQQESVATYNSTASYMHQGSSTSLSSSFQPNQQLTSPTKILLDDDSHGSILKLDATDVVSSDNATTKSDSDLVQEAKVEVSKQELVPLQTEMSKANADQNLPDHKDSSDQVTAENPPDTNEVSSIIQEEKKEEVSEPEKELSEQEKMLQLYIQERLASNKIELAHVEPLQDRIPLHVLNSRKKDPAVDKLNVIEERLAIQRKIFEKRSKIASVIPQAPQYYWEYMTFTGGYLLSGSTDSRLSVPVLVPPSSLCQPMVKLFKAHEEKRVRLRVQHAIQREKLIISCEQEIMRVHSRAARTNQNQQTPFSACAMLMDCEVYTMPRQSNDNEGGKTSIRDRFNARMYLSWLQDVDDKFLKIKSALLARQRHEAEALHAVQKTEWILKCQEVDHSHRTLKPEEVNEIYVPMVNIADDFELLPA